MQELLQQVDIAVLLGVELEGCVAFGHDENGGGLPHATETKVLLISSQVRAKDYEVIAPHSD